MKRGAWLSALALCSQLAIAASEREAFTQPLASLTEPAQLEQFFQGRGLFRQAWVIAPSRDEGAQGLGPLYNRITCIACHPRNGRGQAPDAPTEPMRSMLVRLSVPGHDAHGGPRPHPAYGDQLNELAVPGVRGEGRAQVHWHYQHVALRGGESVELRKPRLTFSELAYGPLGEVQTSARVGTPVFGLGLLEAVSGDTLLKMAEEAKPDGVRGQVNQVWSVERQRSEPGRLGLKANQPDLRQQIASALHGDLGITSSLYPQHNCTALQMDCQRAVLDPQPELAALPLGALHFYLAHLAPPPRRDLDKPQVRRGEQVFANVGCAVCHRPQLVTDGHPTYPALSHQIIHPYTDLLLHDMGEGLADGRADYLATGQQWRTAPLWGLGLTEQVSPGAGLLHDGRARNVIEAILWHGGEALKARERFIALEQQDRQALLAFLNAL